MNRLDKDDWRGIGAFAAVYAVVGIVILITTLGSDTLVRVVAATTVAIAIAFVVVAWKEMK